MSKLRDTRLLNKQSFDNPTEFCEAGSTTEADMLAEWSRDELVECIQELDQKLFNRELAANKLAEAVMHSINSHEWILENCAPYLQESADKRSILNLISFMKKALAEYRGEVTSD